MHEHDEKVLEQVKIIEAANIRIKASKEIFERARGNHDKLVGMAGLEIIKAWEEIGTLLKESGEIEVILPSEIEGYVYKIAPRQSTEGVEIPDIDALPEKYIKIERTPKKKELLADLKAMRDNHIDPPNYATIVRDPPKLSLELVKDK
ncbi:MAG: hypothetical protein WC100_01725 [Sterolibacterium sp.]